MPSNTVTQVYNQLIGPEHRVSRGSIGIEFSGQPKPGHRAHLRIGRDGVECDLRQPGRAGRPEKSRHDYLRRWQGRKERRRSVADIASRKPGSKAKLTFVRNGKKEDTTVTIAERSKLFAARLGEEEEGQSEEAPKASKLGITVRSVTSRSG